MSRKKRSEVGDMIVLIFQVSITMMVPILLCTVGGVYLGRWLHINWIAVIGFFVGAIAGMQNVWRMVKKYIKNQRRPKDEDES